jgi:Interferon-induced transmembrane protein
MSQDWNPGGTLPSDQSQGMPMWQPPGTPVTSGAQVASVSSRWPLAILSIFLWWPLGIFACVFAARVKPALQIGDVTTALTASKRVLIFFWIAFALGILTWIMIAGSGSSSTG